MGIDILICGTGSSLDNVNWDDMPDIRIAINSACMIVPGVTHLAALDCWNNPRPEWFKASPGHITTHWAHDMMIKKCVMTHTNTILIENSNCSLLAAVKYAVYNRPDTIILAGLDGGIGHADGLSDWYDDTDEWRLGHDEILYDEYRNSAIVFMREHDQGYQFLE